MESESNQNQSPCRVIILDSRVAEAKVLSEMVSDATGGARVKTDLQGLPQELDGADILIVASEILSPEISSRLLDMLGDRPVWDRIPVILVCHHLDKSERYPVDRNFMEAARPALLERPIRIPQLRGLLDCLMRIRSGQLEAGRLLGQFEERLNHAQKFEAIGKLANGIAHDFNNLLTAVNGYSDLVLSMMRSDDVLRPNLEEIRKAGERAARLTQQLLTYSRQKALSVRLIDLNELVRSMEDVIKRLVGESVDVEFRLDPNVGRINADVGQIEQAIMNLAANARDAMPGGGLLEVVTGNIPAERVEDGLLPAGERRTHSFVTVKDSGSGMSEEVIGRIFEPFFTTRNPELYAGLGLSAVQGAARQFGGFVRVQSHVGQGSEFQLFWPHAEQDVEAMDTAPPQEIPIVAENETILVVEDESMVRDFMAQILRNSGYRVLTASKGMEAILVSTNYQEDIHMLLTDVVMPGMSGRELAETLVSLRPGIKVLYVSGYTDDAVLQHGVLVGKVAFLNKPFSSRDLLEKVRQVLKTRVHSHD